MSQLNFLLNSVGWSSKNLKSVTDKILLPLTKYEPQMNLAWPTNVLKEKMKTVDQFCVLVTEGDEIHLELKKLSYKLDGQHLSDQKKMEFFSTLMPILEEIESQEWDLDSDYLLKNIQRLEQTCKDAYICYETAHVAVAYVIPKLQTRLAAIWLPLDPVDPSDEACRRFILPWKLHLEPKTLHNLAEAMDPYHKLIWQGWMPMLRNVISQWKCQESGPMIDLLDRWEPLLPDWIMDQMKTLLLRRIWSDIEAWNPKTDPAAIHTWIHPWIPRLGDKLSLCSVVLEILPKAFVHWEPSDESARSLIMAWIPFVTKWCIEHFVVENILPNLRRALSMWTVHSDLPSQDWRKNLNFWRKSKNMKCNCHFSK
jgi:tuftelin-interacting protein 11